MRNFLHTKPRHALPTPTSSSLEHANSQTEPISSQASWIFDELFVLKIYKSA